PPSVRAEIASQLARLPFQHYALLDMQSVEVDEGMPGEFQITAAGGERHTVNIVPHHVAGDRVDVTVSWRGPSGEDLLSTKLRVGNKRPVVLGADGAEASTILRVKLNCD
ncbi:MAG: hypothetical protein KDD44_11555, partial [Bdellovibrionales bacterium]|nr:hypothetical protein [Bdellovibrionales bacterium]